MGKHKTLQDKVGWSMEPKKMGLGGTLGLPWQDQHPYHHV